MTTPGGDVLSAGEPEVLPYNFRRPPRISRERQTTLEAIHSRLALSLQSLFTSRLRQATDVGVVSVEQATFADFVHGMTEPCITYVFDLGERAGGQAAFELDGQLTAYLLEKLFGGSGGGPVLERALTPLEQTVLGTLADRTMGLLKEAYGDLLAIDPSLIAFESMPGTLHIAQLEDNVLVSRLQIRSGASTGRLAICLPLLLLEAFLQEKGGPPVQASRLADAERVAARQSVETHVRAAHVPVAARLPEFRVSAIDLAYLHEGQILTTGQTPQDDVEILVNGERRFLGALGRQHGHVGLRITRSSAPTHSTPHLSRRNPGA